MGGCPPGTTPIRGGGCVNSQATPANSRRRMKRGGRLQPKPKRKYPMGGSTRTTPVTNNRFMPRGTKQGGRVEINLNDVARNEINSMGEVTRIINPYNINAIIDRAKIEYQQRAGRPISGKNLTELTNIVKLIRHFVGAHYHTLEEWAADNSNLVISTLGLSKNDLPPVGGWWQCSGSCSDWGVGSCSGVCGGALCETVPGVTDPGTGIAIVPSSKTYGVTIRIALD